MELSQQQQKAQEFLSSIYAKVWGDDDFKQNLIRNPIETLNKFTGKKAIISADKIVVVEDQTNPNHIYLNIPAKPNMEDVELTEAQLEIVAGGGDDVDFWDAVYLVATNPVYTIDYILNN